MILASFFGDVLILGWTGIACFLILGFWYLVMSKIDV